MSVFTSLYRSLTHHRLFALLNIGGLALGIAASLIVILFVRFETGYDRVLPGWDKLWVLHEQYTRPGDPPLPNPYTMGGELDQLRGDFPDLVGTRYDHVSAIIRQGGVATSEPLVAVDADFFRLMPFPVLSGDPSAAIADPDGIVITQTVARKYLGSEPALGRTLNLMIDGKTYPYRVGAVVKDMPANVSFTSEMFVRLTRPRFVDRWFDHWGSSALATILRFPDAAAAQAFQAQLPGFLGRHAYPDGNVKPETYHQLLRPLSAYHLADPADASVVTTLGVVGVLTLLIAMVNYVNLATARAGLRAREVAVRKVLGGTRAVLIAQFLGEAMATAAIAALIGLALAELALPLINALGGTTLAIRYWGADTVLLPLLLLVLVVGGVAGLYPAFVLSRFQPASVLASARAPGGGRAGARVRGALVVVQFAIAIAFAISTAVMLTQTAHVAAADVGYRRDGLIVVRSFVESSLDNAQKAQLLASFRTVPGVTSVGVGLNAPGDQNSTNTSTINRPRTPDRSPNSLIIDAGPGYFDTVETRLVAGRLFNPSFGADDSGRQSDTRRGPPANVVINETAVRQIGFASPADAIGKPLEGNGAMRVIGVIADQRFRSPRDPVFPTVYFYTTAPVDSSFAILRYAGDDAPAVIDRLAARWKQIAPAVPFQARTANQNLYERYYKADAQRSRLFTFGSVLAIVIGCIGLYGLAAFDTARRIKEIGIRKTLGASTADVLRLLVAKFLRPVLVANLIAWPLAWVAMQRWLAGFDDRIALSPVFFVGAGAAAVVIATATVLGQAWRVARAEPARALRYE